jgi:prepilin-type N-terminal cleavage/methylation domain-containing protein
MNHAHGTPRQARRPGFSLVEMLIVIAIMAVLLGLMLPAVQTARESARRIACLNNIRQIGVAMRGFEAVNGFFAPANSTGANAVWPPHAPREHGMFALLLPHLEQENLLTSLGYDYEQDWDAAANRPAAQTIISTFACGSTPDGPRKITAARYPTNPLRSWQPACNDYAPIVEVEPVLYTALGLPVPPLKQRQGMLPTNSRPTAAHLHDGSSYTLAIVECGNRPLRYLGRHPMGVRSAAASAPCNFHNDTSPAAWADNGATFTLHGADAATGAPNAVCYHTDSTGRMPPAGTTSGGRCVMNCTNWAEPYAFHPGGMNVLLGDASVRFLAEDIDPQTFVALVTRAGGDSPGAF